MEREKGNRVILQHPKQEVGPIANRDSRKMKFLKRAGKFLMYGGWILVVVLGFGIYLALSALSQ